MGWGRTDDAFGRQRRDGALGVWEGFDKATAQFVELGVSAARRLVRRIWEQLLLGWRDATHRLMIFMGPPCGVSVSSEELREKV